MFTLVFCLQTIKRNEPALHSDAFLGQRLVSLTLHGRSTALNCAITTVQYRPYQYRRILYGHVVGMVRCDWPFTVGYIIIILLRLKNDCLRSFCLVGVVLLCNPCNVQQYIYLIGM